MASIKTELMGNAHFEVEITGEPSPTVAFFKNGTQITESSKYQLSNRGNIYSLDINCCTEGLFQYRKNLNFLFAFNIRLR